MGKRYDVSATLQVKGLDELIKHCRKMASPKTAAKILRRATNAATTPLLRAIKAEIPVDSGLLKKSMAKKVVGKNFKYNGVVGSDVSKLEPDGQTATANHLHLVEFGFETVDGKVVPGQFPLQKGYAASKAQVQKVYESKIASELEKEATKAAAAK